jgi:hypothetical protein
MKIFILFLLLLISPVELRRRTDDDIYELDDTNNNLYDRPKHYPNKQYIADENDDDDDQYYPSSFQQKKVYPSRKKVLNENEYNNDEPESNVPSDDLLPAEITTTNQNDLSDKSICINKYDINSEQLVKVKELKNGAHMIRHVLIDKRSLPSDVNIRDSCMLDCCTEETCDLAMLSEQPTHVN